MQASYAKIPEGEHDGHTLTDTLTQRENKRKESCAWLQLCSCPHSDIQPVTKTWRPHSCSGRAWPEGMKNKADCKFRCLAEKIKTSLTGGFGLRKDVFTCSLLCWMWQAYICAFLLNDDLLRTGMGAICNADYVFKQKRKKKKKWGANTLMAVTWLALHFFAKWLVRGRNDR